MKKYKGYDINECDCCEDDGFERCFYSLKFNPESWVDYDYDSIRPNGDWDDEKDCGGYGYRDLEDLYADIDAHIADGERYDAWRREEEEELARDREPVYWEED